MTFALRWWPNLLLFLVPLCPVSLLSTKETSSWYTVIAMIMHVYQSMSTCVAWWAIVRIGETRSTKNRENNILCLVYWATLLYSTEVKHFAWLEGLEAVFVWSLCGLREPAGAGADQTWQSIKRTSFHQRVGTIEFGAKCHKDSKPTPISGRSRPRDDMLYASLGLRLMIMCAFSQTCEKSERILYGDEYGRSQWGCNNGWCQDTRCWFSWSFSAADEFHDKIKLGWYSLSLQQGSNQMGHGISLARKRCECMFNEWKRKNSVKICHVFWT